MWIDIDVRITFLSNLIGWTTYFVTQVWRLVSRGGVCFERRLMSFATLKPPGRSLPLIFCIHMRSGPIYWGGYLPCKKDYRWWYFTCKKFENIICDGILHVNMFHYIKIPYFTCKFFYKIYLQWIYWTLFFIARCSTIFAQWSPRAYCVHFQLHRQTWLLDWIENCFVHY
jgi:hypothetical protein